MHFHEYRTLRNQSLGADSAKYPVANAIKPAMKRISSAEWRRHWIDGFTKKGNATELDWGTGTAALAEDIWVDEQRPYYNVWPIAVDLASKVTLDLHFSSVGIASYTMLLRFPKGHEPFGVRVAMIFWPKDQPFIVVFAYLGTGDRLCVRYKYTKDQTVQAWLDAILNEKTDAGEDQAKIGEMVVRLGVFISLLARDEDLITPIVLAKDRAKYDAATDEATKRTIEERAARRAGRGFDLGKQLQLERDTSPHWRNPHPCLFWTGKGGSTPLIKMRSGAVIQRTKMAEVPTGYLGPELPDEDEPSPPIAD